MPQIRYSTYNEGTYNTSLSFFRSKLAWKMLEESGIKYDYVFKMRPDVLLLNDTLPCLKSLDINIKRQIYFVWDVCIIGRYNIMQFYCNLFDRLSDVEHSTRYPFEHNGFLSHNVYYGNNAWSIYTAEKQVCNNLMYFAYINDMNIDEALKDSRIDFSLSRRNFTHHRNNGFPSNYYISHPDYTF